MPHFIVFQDPSIIGQGERHATLPLQCNRRAHRQPRKASDTAIHTGTNGNTIMHTGTSGASQGRHYPHQRTPTPPWHHRGGRAPPSAAPVTANHATEDARRLAARHNENLRSHPHGEARIHRETLEHGQATNWQSFPEPQPKACSTNADSTQIRMIV